MENLENHLDNSTASGEADANTLKATSYVAKTIKEMIAFCNNAYNQLGNHAYHDKDAIARANNLSYFSIKQSLSTAGQYGLLHNKYGGGYKLTDLFISIVHPKDDAEYIGNIIKCFNNSQVLRELNTAFNNKRLPATSGIVNTLIRDRKYKEEVATKVANVYLQNLKDFKLLDANGFVNIPTGTIPKHADNNGGGVTPPVAIKQPEQQHQSGESNETKTLDILIPLKGKREAHLYIPEEYKDEDLERIIKFVDALKNE